MTTANKAWSTRRRRSNKAGKNDPCRSFYDPQIEVPSGGRQRSRPRAVALGGAIDRTLEWGGADERARLPPDQLLVQHLGRGPDPVGDISELQLSKKFEQGRLV